ncbi:MAG: UDP-N-acetylmuramoyl-L-alanyl-D-glutamate--2,6-diaminopimelate ligase [Prevotellaceae bacterium]|jgi:UDP-N-acetylmuramoyl-L-alanyl-D-glutamate--2,6-diaminopimelate ligase|nr:UDP-N-acetylmuramoyl-L-alanyl-D-glutamate--2,6-diaminopimelate ligase [Prevotellaceae bacterium]
MKKLSNILENIPIQKVIGNADIEIDNIQFDSRKVTAGSLFFATRGTVSDGHTFIPMAIEKGAVAIVCEELPETTENVIYIVVENSLDALGKAAANYFDNPSEKLILVGVTGTNGKTSTATLLYELFRNLNYRAGLLSTVCNYIDGKAVEATHTTPDPIELNGLLAEMVAAGCEYAFMEVSSHSIDQRRIAGLRFAGGIFTNLTQDHLDYHKTMQEYLKAKKRFFDELPADAWALTNNDDKNGMVMLQNTRAKKYTYSIRGLADFKTRIIEHSFEGMLLKMNGREVFVQFVGKFNASNLTAVFGAAMLLSPPAPQRGENHTAAGNCNSPLWGAGGLAILTILSTLHSVSGRFETIRSDKGFTAIVDYAHTDDALLNVIGTINQILQGEGKLITVCGCGGDRDKTKRPKMARAAFDGSNRVIFTSDNPRTEAPQAILNDMLAGLTAYEQNQVLTILDRREAIKTACALAQKGDVILIAGKGHEDYQIIGKEKHHFDDREVVKSFI